jgi:hypothetical protein
LWETLRIKDRSQIEVGIGQQGIALKFLKEANDGIVKIAKY